MDRARFRERYLRDEWPRQFGNLASTLTRLASHAEDERFDPLVADLLREGALLIEWSASQAPPEQVEALALMQRELLLWRQIWPAAAARSLPARTGGGFGAPCSRRPGPTGLPDPWGLVTMWLLTNVPVHAVIALDEGRDRILMVTMYQPSEEDWEDDWKTRQ